MATDAAESKHHRLLEVNDSKSPDRRRQGKFKPFRQLFGKKKKRDAKGNFAEAQLKVSSFSSGEVCDGVVSEDEESNQNLRDLHPVGSRALSHDSIFIPEEALKELALNHSMSQENVSDKVKHLQKQIAQGIKFGQRPPSLRKSEGDEGSSEEEEVLRSPLKVLAQVEAEPQKTEVKVTEVKVSTPLKSPRSKQVLPPTGTIESVNLDAVPHSVPLLDNAAAKHKLSVKPKNQRISRKHRRFTQDLQEVSIPGLVREELEAAGGSSFDQRRASAEDFHWESLKKQRLHEEERQEAKRRREQEEQILREEEEKRAKEELKLQKLEEERFRKQQEEAERKRKEEEDRRIREEEEQKMRDEAEKRRKEEEEKKIWEKEQRRQREEAENKRKEEEKRIREELERQKREEAEKMRKEEERMRKEEERKRQEEDERKKKEEEMRIQEEERMRKLVEEREKQERQSQQKQEEERRQLEEQRRKEEEIKKKKEEERRKREEEVRRQHELDVEKKRKEEEERKKKELEEKLRLQEMENMTTLEKEKMKKEEEQRKMSLEEDYGSLDTEERKRRAEELRWKEMEERQRPFSFKVSSGEKQILFQKVNLTPVTLASSLQTAAVVGQGEGARAPPPEAPDPPNLPTSPYVPHTAILVTGAQLCGTAVNLDQIKDTACKSLLGLGEDRKTQGTPPTKSKTSPEHRSGKTKSLTESVLSTDQASAAVLAEWASIRSKIFKGVEDGKYDEYPDPQNRNQPQPPSEEQLPFAHTNLRKTMSSSPKFSITPAKKKFGDLNRNSELFGPEEKDAKEEASGPESPPASSPASTSKPHQRTSKTVRIVERGSEECVFAKDLPSFLVPSPGERPEGNELKSRLLSEPEKSDSRHEGEERGGDAEDKPSPFGIKLRRTNYSLRFHSEQSTEKRKKRYSAGDSFEGVPSPLTPIDPDSDVSSVFSDKSSPTSPQKDGAACKFLHASSPAFPKGKSAKSASTASHSEVLSKPPLYRRPPTSPKPSGGTPTPPPSPLPKAGHEAPCDDVVHRDAGSSSLDLASRTEEPSTAGQLYWSSQGEEEPKEKRSFFPSINIPWREKADRKAELIKKAEKPSLQSRHSLDSPKVQDKEAGPLWITLALQKQKGFREQQQNREERRSLRETRLAEKQTREKETAALMSPTDSKESGSPSSKPQTPEELKRPDSLLGRFERREHLKKANTLPGSVTVEIADSTPSPPAVKDLSKRFPSTDSPGVSTEPAWLALAKRKAKAWSDCPQIIK